VELPKQALPPLWAYIYQEYGSKAWDETTSPNSMTSLALYGLLRSLILARNAIPKNADFQTGTEK